MSELFNSSIFNNSVFNVGDDDAVSLQVQRPPNSDFVISPPYYLHEVQLYRKLLAEKKPEAADQPELKEMTEIYDLFMKSPAKVQVWPQA